LKIAFISVGNLKKSYAESGVAEYVKRIKRYVPVETVDVKEEKAPAKTPREEIMRREGERILGRLKPGDYSVALTDTGAAFSSAAFSDFISGHMDSGTKRLCFIIGGAWGLHPDVLKKASATLSLSSMTFPHDLARLVLAEQVYRAFTIIRGEPYSH
jgi:23S rRNA (pseudouridine1915-N3)-methyltransferase